jgi:hypothetical protein
MYEQDEQRELRKSILVISSEDKLSPLETSSRFTVRIRPAITSALSCRLLFAIIPNSTYNVNTTNNVFVFDDGSVRTLQIAPGSYTAATLATAVAAAMTAAGAQTYTVVYNAQTYHYTISAPGPFALLYTVFASTSLFPTMGFLQNVNGLPALSHESTGAVRLWDYPYFVIRVDKIPARVQNTQGDSNFGSFIVNNTTAQDGTLKEWTQNSNYNEVTGVNVNMDFLSVELRDHRGALADINSSNWTFAIEITHET